MANYTNMVSTNQKRARKLETLAINAINEMVTMEKRLLRSQNL